jgi:hypothetical protein
MMFMLQFYRLIVFQFALSVRLPVFLQPSLLHAPLTVSNSADCTIPSHIFNRQDEGCLHYFLRGRVREFNNYSNVLIIVVRS